MKLGLGIFLLGILFSPVPTGAQVAALDRVPIRYLPPTLVVVARVNGSAPLPFALDTGSTAIMLDARVAGRLAIRSGTEKSAARVRSLAIGKAIAYDLEVVLRDLSRLRQQVGVPLAGIIGYPWMEWFILEIDYGAGTLTLWPRAAELSPPAHALVVPLELRTGPGFSGAGIFVTGRLNNRVDCPFEIDTGTDIGVLGAHIARLGRTSLSPGSVAVSDPESSTLHRVDILVFGGRMFAHVPFRVDPNRGTQGEPYLQCVIGNEQLREFVFTLDLPHRRMFFRPVSRAPGAR